MLDAIGNTPLVELSRITRDLDGRILAKLDYLNPGGSEGPHRAAHDHDAEASRDLAPGQAVVELTSGNTGAGLAIVCAVTAHPFVAVMSAGNSEERAQMMRALGAEVILVDQQEGSKDGHVSGEDLGNLDEAVDHAGKTIAIVLADSGMKYLSTDLWDADGVGPPSGYAEAPGIESVQTVVVFHKLQ